MKSLLARFLSLGTIPLAAAPAAPSLIPVGFWDGNLPDNGALTSMLGLMSVGGMNHSGRVNFQTASGTTITLTALDSLFQRLTAGAAVTVTIDSAYNIVSKIPSPYVGQQFPFQIVTNAATTVATPTLLDGSVTLSGTTSVPAAAIRWYSGQITQMTTTSSLIVSTGTTFTSITQIGTSNLYTVALGTNVNASVLGQAIYLNVTTGTLPSGWYPITTATSATSFVIATPPSSAAWTATAVTFPNYATAPNVYSPALTITGVCATVTAIMSV